MIPFLRRMSAVLVIRRGVIALAGGACAALCAVILAGVARPQLEPVETAPIDRPTIIDGPPRTGEAAPPPPTPQSRRRRAEPFAERDDDDYEDTSAASPFETAPQPEPQAAMQAAQTQTFETQAPQSQTSQTQTPQRRTAPQTPCAELASPADQMVCYYPRLNAADAAVQRLYGMALYRTENPEALREEQRRWRAVRDQVAAQDGPEALAEVYAERIQELDGPY